MIDVKNEIKQAYEESTTQIDRIILDGEPYRINEVNYDDDCYENGNIFGTAIARSLEFQIENSIDLEKKEFEYQTGIYINNQIEWTSLGNFIVQDIEPNDTTKISKVVAFDYMFKSNIPYESKLDYSSGKITILDVLQESCEQSGLELATTDFVNNNFIVDSNQFSEGTLNRQVFQAVAQISGTFAKIRSDNKLHLIIPKRKGILVEEVNKMTVAEFNKLPIEKLSENSNKFSTDLYKELVLKRNTHPINLVSLGMSDIEGENITLRDEESISKEGENSLVINDNPFAYTQEKREQLIIALFNTVKGFEYTAFEIEGQAKPYLETGDEIVVKDAEGNFYYSFLFRFNYKSPNGLESIMEAPSIIKSTVAYQNIPDALSIAKKTEIVVNKQEQKIRQLVQETSENSDKLTKVEQTVDNISQKVSNIETFTNTIEAVDQIHLTNTIEGEEYVIQFSITGNMPFLTPSETLVPSEDLVPLGDYFTLIIDKQSRANKSEEAVEIVIDLDEPLRVYKNIYDEIFCENDIWYVIRRIGIDDKFNLYILENEIIEEITNIKIPTFEDDTYIYVKEYEGLNYSAYYIVKNQYEKIFATKTELSSSIDLSKNSILEEVKLNYATVDDTKEIKATLELKVDIDKLISEINASADVINLKANRLVIDSTNFKLTKEGKVTSTSGEIGGFKITSNSLSTSGSKKYTYKVADAEKVVRAITGAETLTDEEIIKYDINQDGEINIVDATLILNTINGTTSEVPTFSGKFEINNNSLSEFIKIYNNEGTLKTTIGLGTATFSRVSANQLFSNDVHGKKGTFVDLDVTGTFNNSSDKNKKENIKELDDKYEDLLELIKPHIFNFIDDENKKEHIGFIAQEVENAFEQIGIIASPVIKRENPIEKRDDYFLEYNQFLGIMWKILQIQNKKIKKLEKGENNDKNRF